MKHRLTFFAVLMMAMALPQLASAYSYSAVAPSGQTFYYNIVNGNAQVTYERTSSPRYSNLTGDLVIPSTVHNRWGTYTVTEIGSCAFLGCSGLTSVTIPNSVTSIGDYAFENCSGLTSVTIPNRVTEIGSCAFLGCSGLTSIIVDSSNTVYDSRDNCNAIIKISTNTLIAGCQNTIIPSSVTSIGNYAFCGCSGLTSVTIPNSVTSIGLAAFTDCSGLTSISVDNGNMVYDSRNNCNAIIETSTNTLIAGCQNTIIPNSVTSIRESAFSGCSGLTSVTIPNSVTTIGDWAFHNCNNLTSVTIGSSVTSIGNYAFENCSDLTSVTIGNSVTSIGHYAFSNCSGLTSVTIPNSVTSIGNRAFSNCQLDSLTIGYGLQNIATDVFMYDSVSYLNYNCPANVPGAINKSRLTTAIIGDNVTSIGYGVFSDCRGLTSVTIGNSVTSIGNNAFRYCSGLTSVNYTGTVAQWCNINFSNNFSNPILYSRSLSINGSPITNLVISEGVTEIKKYAFNNCSSLTSVTIGKSVSSIGYRAFYDCTALSSVVFNADSCISVRALNLYVGAFGTNITSFTFGSNVKYIPDSLCFGMTGLTSITIPDSVVKIGKQAFCHCTGLTSVNIPNSVTYLSGFSSCTGLTSVTIPNSVTSIGEAAFSGCTGLTSVTIPNSVTSIGEAAFSGCTGLTSVTIPNSVTSIEEYAFSNCTGLTSVTIGNSVTSIGEAGFSGCNGMSSMKFLGQMPPQLGINAFAGIPTGIPVYIPCGRIAYYAAQIPQFSNYVETMLNFYAMSDDESMGTVQILTEPSCTNPNAVLNAVPADGYRFDHWSTGSTDNPYTFTVTSDTTIIGYFVANGTQGIDNVEGRNDIQISVLNGHIYVEGIADEEVHVYDIAGRMVPNRSLPFGVYMVKIGNHPARKIVVVR